MNDLKLTCIVEDQADYRFLLQKTFAMSFPHHPVCFFGNGKALLDELPHLKPLPILILMDKHMPELDGYHTLLILKQHPEYQLIPVIMMSADASPAEVEACYRAGANSFLDKQMGFTAMVETISRIGHYWLEINRASRSSAHLG